MSSPQKGVNSHPLSRPSRSVRCQLPKSKAYWDFYWARLEGSYGYWHRALSIGLPPCHYGCQSTHRIDSRFYQLLDFSSTLTSCVLLASHTTSTSSAHTLPYPSLPFLPSFDNPSNTDAQTRARLNLLALLTFSIFLRQDFLPISSLSLKQFSGIRPELRACSTKSYFSLWQAYSSQSNTTHFTTTHHPLPV